MSDAAEPKLAEVIERAVQLAEQGDTFRAMEHLETGADPVAVAGRYSQSVRVAYHEKQNVALMIMLGRAGIQYCLTTAKLQQDDALQEKLKGQAKTMSYNLSANCWPGWDDEGITITATDLACGLDAARLNLRLADELGRDATVFTHAHWLLGAHLLAAGKYEQAQAQFETAAEKARESKHNDNAHMAAAYRALARLLAERNEQRVEEFTSAVTELKKLGTDDGKFFAEQVQTARRVFEGG